MYSHTKTHISPGKIAGNVAVEEQCAFYDPGPFPE